MKSESKKLLVKAGRALRAAGLLLRDGAPDFAAGRAYYAMFYAAEAALAEKDLEFRKHSGVHAAFGDGQQPSVGEGGREERRSETCGVRELG